MTKKIIFTAELIDRIRNRMDDIRYSEENRADLDEVFAEWRRLKTIETEISVLVAEGSNGDVGSEYLLECMENMLVGGLTRGGATKTMCASAQKMPAASPG